jgi:hypothetical protein
MITKKDIKKILEKSGLKVDPQDSIMKMIHQNFNLLVPHKEEKCQKPTKKTT